MEARDVRSLVFEEYLELDRNSDERWEYANGTAWASRGASPEHGVVARNVLVALTVGLRDRECIPLPDGQKVATPATGAYHYPDASVVCEKPAYDDRDPNALVNPALIVEVLSPTTADYDRGGKLAHYRTLASLREVVIISWENRLVEHHQRVGPDQWLVTLIRDGELMLPTLDVALPVDALWADLDRIRPQSG